jgi:hypothetical protein
VATHGQSAIPVEVTAHDDGLTLRITTGETAAESRVALITQPAGFGGTRVLFACPRCKAPVRRLYWRGGFFGCRVCQHLDYRSRRRSPWQRVVHKIQQRKLAFGLPPNLEPVVVTKPPGWRWFTFASRVLVINNLYKTYYALEKDRRAKALSQLAVVEKQISTAMARAEKIQAELQTDVSVEDQSS